MSGLFNPGYYDEHELQDAGFGEIGRNVRIARNCTIIGMEHITIGDNVRIDGYCTITASESGKVALGSFIHIGAYCLLAGGDGIELADFCGLSHGVRVYSRSDDYSGEHLTNPTVPQKYTKIARGKVTLGRHAIVGTGTVILPSVTIGEGTSVGASSLVTKDLDSWGIYFGCPAKRLKDRSRKLLVLEEQLRQELADHGSSPDDPARGLT